MSFLASIRSFVRHGGDGGGRGFNDLVRHGGDYGGYGDWGD